MIEIGSIWSRCRDSQGRFGCANDSREIAMRGSFFIGGLESVHFAAADVIEWRQEYYRILGTVLKCLLVFLRIYVLSALSVTQSG